MPARDPVRRILDAYIVEKDAVVDRGLKVPAERKLVVGNGATIVGGIRSEGRVYLGRDVVVRGPIRSAGDVVVGAKSRVEGDVESGTYVLVQEGAVVTGRVRCDGPVRIVGGRIDGPVDAGGDIEVRADASTHELKAGGRIRSLPDPVEPNVRDS